MPANRIANLTESVIREMTRIAIDHGAINLSQGFPDFPTPEPLKQAAYRAIADDAAQSAAFVKARLAAGRGG